jgi:hypothetical protein
MLVVASLALWVFHLTASANYASAGHFYSTAAFYAAESGIEMALAELNQSPPTDIDSDGTIGSISDNGNDADDPAVATGAFSVSRISVSPAVYRATGRPTTTQAPWNAYRRVMEVQTN